MRRGVAALAVAVLLASCGGGEPRAEPAAQADSQPPAEPVTDLVREAVWNRDGSRLAVSWNRRGRVRLYGLFGPYRGDPPQPSQGLPITSREGAWASFSPDGLWVAFETTRDGNGEVYRVHPDGMGPENLTRDPADDGEPDYAPDGRHLVFTSDRDPGGPGLWIMDADGGNPRELDGVVGREPRGPAWSRDSASICYYAGDGGVDAVFVLPARGGEARRVAAGAFPAWDRDGGLFYSRGDSVFHRAGGEASDETFVTVGSAPHPSPDGRWLAVVRGRPPRAALYLVETAGGAESRITP